MVTITRGLVEIRTDGTSTYRSRLDGKWDQEWQGENMGEANEELSALLDFIMELYKTGTNCPSCGCTI